MIGLYCGLAFLLLSSFIGWRLKRSYLAKQKTMEDYGVFLDFAKRKMLSKKGGESSVFADYKTNEPSIISDLKAALEGGTEKISSAPDDSCAREILNFWRNLRSVDYAFLEEHFAEHEAFSAAEIAKRRNDSQKYGVLYSKLGVLIGCLLLILML